MPIYEYQCQACGKRHEAIQRLADPVLTVCPDCGGALKKLVSSPAFQFKGTGWYVTDYANKKGAGSEGSKGSGKSEGEQGASPSSEKTSEKNAEKSPGQSSDSAKSSEAKSSSDSKSTEAAKTSTKQDSAKSADS